MEKRNFGRDYHKTSSNSSKSTYKLIGSDEQYSEIITVEERLVTITIKVKGKSFVKELKVPERSMPLPFSMQAIALLRMEVRMWYAWSDMELAKATGKISKGEEAKYMAIWGLTTDRELIEKVKDEFY